ILIMGASFGDLDNDGWLDFYLGTGDSLYTSLLPNRMFRNDSGRGFQDVTTAGGFGHLQKGHSLAFGDFDNDGEEVVFEEMGAAPGPLLVTVHWPASNTTQTFRTLAVDHAYVITEGDAHVQPITYRQFRLPDPVIPSDMTTAGP